MTEDDKTDEENKPDPSVLRRRQAQGAAGDLARMGIDPRSLGLGDPSPSSAREPAPALPADRDDRAQVVPLHPGLRQPVSPEPAPAPPPSVDPPLLGRQLAPAPAPPVSRQAGRLLSTVARGLATPDAAVSAQSERELIDAVRQRQSDRRVVAFMTGKGGVGCTTVAVGVGTTFTALREDHSVVIDVQQGTPSLGEWFGAGDPRSVSSMLGEAEVSAPPVTAGGLGLLDGAGWDQSFARAEIAGVLDRLGEEHTFHLFDVGDDAGEGGHAALARADQVVIVSGPGRLGIAATDSALRRLKGINPMTAERAVHVVVCPTESSQREAGQRLVSALSVRPAAVVVVPPDSYLRDGEGYDPGRISTATREALLRVAAAVASQAGLL